MNNKIIISFIILTIVGAFGYFILSQKSAPIITEQPLSQNLPNAEGQPKLTKAPPLFETPISYISPSATAEWKIYRNDEYGFEFKYPFSFEMNDYSHEMSEGSLGLVFAEKNGPSFVVSFINPDEIDFTDYGLGTTKYNSKKRECFYLNELSKQFYYLEEKINNYSVCSFGNGDEGVYSLSYYLIHPIKNMSIGIGSSSSATEEGDIQPLAPLKEILSTFKFTK